MSSTSIAALILTYNESKHIARCIESLKGIVDEVFVIDSYSTDDTVAIAESMGAKVYQNPWKNYATQFNWGLDHCPIQSEWVWRIDADEYLEKTKLNIASSLKDLPDEVKGVYVKRKVIFLGQALMHGGWFPVWHLKIWRFGQGRCENRWMDEHIKLSGLGNTVQMDVVQVDENLNDLTWWVAKHNSYASRELIDLLDMKYGIFSENTVVPNLFGTGEQRKRWLKLRYLNIPLFVRPVIYFIYRYVFLLGILDGKAGFVWHVLQGFWYRFLVDAKIFELKLRFGNNQQKIIEYIKTNYSLD